MRLGEEALEQIFDRTDGRCHICGKDLHFDNYAGQRDKGFLSFGSGEAWEVEHSVPRAKGGTNRLNNLYPACISCNRKKGANSSRKARAQHGRTSAPYSKKRRAKTRKTNAAVDLGVGALLGGPAGALILGLLGYVSDPEAKTISQYQIAQNPQTLGSPKVSSKRPHEIILSILLRGKDANLD